MKVSEISEYLENNFITINQKNWEKFVQLFGNRKTRIENVSNDNGELIHRFLQENDKNFHRLKKNRNLGIEVFVIKDGEIVPSHAFSSKEEAIICFRNKGNYGRSWDVFFYTLN